MGVFVLPVSGYDNKFWVFTGEEVDRFIRSGIYTNPHTREPMPGRQELWWRRTLRQLSSSPTGTAAEADLDETPQHDEEEALRRIQEAEEQKKREQEIQAIIAEMEGLVSEEELDLSIAAVASEETNLQEQIVSLQTQIEKLKEKETQLQEKKSKRAELSEKLNRSLKCPSEAT